tara:strand:- start:2483 stop:2752 length:270 start_codon:yes stop_codon:yes gene_type:complete
MAPYDPPNAHYSQVDVSMYEEDIILCMIGKGGKGFYKLTNYLNLEYVWYDQERKVIELWGSFGALEHGAKEKLEKALKNFSDSYIKKDV